MPHSTELAKGMLLTKLESFFVPLPQNHPEKTILFRKQGVRTYCSIVSITTDSIIKILTTTALMGLIVLIFLLWHRLIIVKRIYLAESQLQIPVEKTNRIKPSGKCVVPANSEHSIYIIPNAPGAKAGDSFKSFKLTVTCLPGYGVLETEIVFCVDGLWSHSIPKCVRVCKLDNDPSVQYHCLVTGSIEGIRTCNAYEPLGTVVKPECNSPNYLDVGLPLMRCINGSWDYVAVCSPANECGRVTSNDVDLVIRGPAERKEMPWHVGIYRKTTNPYMQICGGSLISNKLVISAAHCFWDETTIKLLPASRFAVAAGKVYRRWNDRRDVHAQKSDIKEINVPPRFQGSMMNFQEDIAVLILKTPFEYTPFIRPVCLDFDVNLETKQLQPGKKGKVPGWGLTAEHGKASQALKVLEVPYVGIKQCIATMRRESREYLTSDKICAGNGNNAALCIGDSGGGLVFPVSEQSTYRYYLRGIVSIAPTIDNFCNSYSLTTFTQILAHEHFLMQFRTESV